MDPDNESGSNALLLTAAAATATCFRHMQALRAARPSPNGKQRKAIRALHGSTSRSFPIRSFCLRVAGCTGDEPASDLVQRLSGVAAPEFVANAMELVDLDAMSTHALPLARLRDPSVYRRVTLKASGGVVLCDVELDPQQQGSLLGKQMLRIAVQGSGSGRMGEAPLRLLPTVRAATAGNEVAVAVSVPERHRGHAAIERLEEQAHAEASFTLPSLTDYDVVERLTARGG